MPKSKIVQSAFNSGELSPRVAWRTDADRYAYGARRMRNFIPSLQGPARKRPGFRFGLDAREDAWLVPFIYDQRDAWILVFGSQTLRFFSNGGPVVESTKTITGITQASPGVVTSNAHGYSNGDEIFIASVGGMTQLNGRHFIVAGATANTFTLVDIWGTAVNTTAYTAYTSGGTAARLYKIATPWTLAELTNSHDGTCKLSFAQSNDVIYICVAGFQPRKLTRTAATSWAFTTFEPSNGPFQSTNPDQTITVYAGAATGATTLTASSATFASTDVGSLFLLEKKLTEVTTSWESAKSISSGDDRRSQGHYYDALNTATTGTIVPSHTEGSRYDGDTGVNWNYLDSGYGWGEITFFNSSTSVNITVDGRFNAASVGAGNPSTQWALGAWSDTAGWPTHVAFFRDRLCFLRGTKVWGSVPSDYENFAERDAGVIADDSAFAIDFARGQNDSGVFMMAAGDLVIGTEGTEFTVGPISSSDPLGPSNIAAALGPGYGARHVHPVRLGDSVMYPTPSGQTLRNLRFDFASDSYVALNMSAFADHIAKGRMIQMAFAKEPESLVWAVCADGTLPAMAYDAEHNLLAWMRHTPGGAFSTGDPVARSVAVIPSPDGYRDETYALIKRTINGATKYYLEYLADHWDPDTDAAEDMFYVDSGLTYDGSAATAISGLDHLEGASVEVWADGRDVGPLTVSAGAITLASSASVVQVGLAYTGTLESMNIAQPGMLTRILKAFLHMIGSVFGGVGGTTVTDSDTTTWGPRNVSYRFAGYDVDAAIPPVTRVIRVDGEGDSGRETRLEWTHSAPCACTIAGWVIETEVTG